jgi:hypothetical protein
MPWPRYGFLFPLFRLSTHPRQGSPYPCARSGVRKTVNSSFNIFIMRSLSFSKSRGMNGQCKRLLGGIGEFSLDQEREFDDIPSHRKIFPDKPSTKSHDKNRNTPDSNSSRSKAKQARLERAAERRPLFLAPHRSPLSLESLSLSVSMLSSRVLSTRALMDMAFSPTVS